jgi:hypothetical protein
VGDVNDLCVMECYRTYPFYNAVDIEGISPYKAKAWGDEKEMRIKEFI